MLLSTVMTPFSGRYFSRAGQAAPGIFCLAYLVFFALPLILYSHNESEFHSGFLNILRHAVSPALAVLAVLLIFIPLLPEAIFIRIQSLVTAVVLLVYVQSAFLVWDYGPFNGEPIDWNVHAARGIADGTIWIVFLCTAVLFCRRVETVRKPVILFVTLASAIAVAVSALSEDMKFITQPQNSEADDVFRLSKEKNVLVIVLDSFTSPAFESALREYPDLEEPFRDFVFFPDTLAAFSTTAPSIPAILTGVEYDNSEPLKQYMARVLGEKSLPALLGSRGFMVSVMSLPQLCPRMQQPCFRLGKVVSTDSWKIESQEMLELFDISLFRSLPQFLKKMVYNEQRWLVQRIFSRRGGPASHFNSVRFAEIFGRSARADAERPVFKFLHIMIPHSPFRFDAGCNAVEKGSKGISKKEQYQAQAVCSLRLVETMMEALRRLDIYDKTMVVVTADHGYAQRYIPQDRSAGVPILEQALPLLLIKPFESSMNKMAVSWAPASLIDIPRTITEALNMDTELGGESILELSPGAVRTRRYRSYGWHDEFWGEAYLPKMQEFEVAGNARDSASWKKGRKLAPVE